MAIFSLRSPASEMNFSNKTVLVIDDFQGMRSILREMLRSSGVDAKKISMAANGKEGIALLNKGRFDIVLCDFNLGPGKNGQQVLEEAKFRGLIGLSCTWIMITADKTSESVTGAAEYQPDAYLLKPVAEAALSLRLAKVWAKKEAFAEIYEAMKRLDYSKAVRLCDKRLVFDKAHAGDLLRTKCDLLLISGELDRAKEALENILVERDLPWAKASLAKVMFKNGDFSAAKTLLEETIWANSSFLEAHDLLAKTLQIMGDLDGACNVLEQAAKLSPNSVIRQKNLGDVALKMGKLEDAEQAYRKSVSLGENSVLRTAGAYIGLAKACSANANPDEALKVLDQLNKNFATKEVRLKAMAVEGMVFHQNGNADKARLVATELGQLLAKEDIGADSERSLDMARLLMATGDKEGAVALLQREVKNNPENNALLDDIAEIFVHAEMGEEGARLIEASRREAMEVMNRGVLLVRKAQYEEAINAMRSARKAMPSNLRVLLNLAYVLITCIQKNGPTPELIKEARESLLAANVLSPGEPRYMRLKDLLNECSS
ncbi:MAG: response regulator [Nitrosomonas sp.]|nr:response regulator [Nitrosomonas sp.]